MNVEHVNPGGDADPVSFDDYHVVSEPTQSGGGPAVVADRAITVYEGSDGGYYTSWELTRRLFTGRWRHCLHQRDPPRLLVERPDRTLLALEPLAHARLPPWCQVRVRGTGAYVVDTRAPPPVARPTFVG